VPTRAALTLAWLVACGSSEEAPIPPPSSSFPLRAVSLAPAGSELLLELGAAHLLVAVDDASRRIPGLRDLPAVDLAGAAALDPDLLLVPALSGADERLFEELRARGSDVIEVAPHNLDDAFGLCRGLGTRLVGAVRAARFVNTLGAELARIGGASFGRPRPRIAAVLAVAPLEIAGGHSFVTDLIEIAGGTSVSHFEAEPRIPTTAEELYALRPDLVLVTSPSEMSERERAAVRAALPGVARLDFFVFDPERFWVRDGVDTARRLRAIVEPLSRELERETD
jgi:ABC-type hemin transport system substrate-binding protein